ncbi:MAG: hypothetical protein AAB381_01660 [Patescibacteria group bacterium]
MYRAFLIIISLVVMVPHGSFVHAEEYTSSSYTVLHPVLTPAGFGTSGLYRMWGSLTEIAIGTSTATDYSVQSGFLYYPEVTVPVVSPTAGDAQVTLSWTAAQGFLGWTATSYRVGQSTVSGGPYIYTSVGGVLSSIRTSLTNGTPYYFVIVVNDAYGSPIGTSTEVTSTPVAGTTPTPGDGGGGGGSTSYFDYILGTNVFCSIEGDGEHRGADLNRDGRVNLVDLSILLYHLGRFDPRYDCNSDDKVDFVDISIMFYHWTE